MLLASRTGDQMGAGSFGQGGYLAVQRGWDGFEVHHVVLIGVGVFVGILVAQNRALGRRYPMLATAYTIVIVAGRTSCGN